MQPHIQQLFATERLSHLILSWICGPADQNTQTSASLPTSAEAWFFLCNGDQCEAWMYQPTNTPAGSKPPVVVMAHGMGGQKVQGTICLEIMIWPTPLPAGRHCFVCVAQCSA